MHAGTEARLTEILDRELALAESLASLLEAERAALVGDSAEAVVEHATHKARLVADFEECDARRRDLCAQAGIGAAAGLGGPGLPPAVAARWRSLLAQAAACRSANEVNGYIVNARHHQVRQLIDALRGGAPITYGPRGRTNSPSLRPLAQA